MSDPIADMLTRIRNANAVHHTEVIVPYSKVKAAVAQVLLDNGYIDDYRVSEAPKQQLQLQLRQQQQPSRITHLQRVSKPGRRVYANAQELPRVLRGRGIAIVSTSSGVMSDDEARSHGIGGEVMCKVW